MLPSCNMLLCLLVWVTAYGNTLTISSTVNSTEFVSDPFTGLTINSSCENAYQCRGKLVCIDGQCKCSENYIWNGTRCIEEKTFNSKCKLTTECDTTLFCIYGTCQCAQMYYWNGHICVSKKTVNDTCTNSKECGGKIICEDGVCQCLVDLFWNGNQCIFKNLNGQSCESSVECAENLECRESFCQCSESEYWKISKCYKKKDENSFCNSSIECKASLQCRNNNCICCDKDYWNGQFCERNICAVEQCMNGGKCQISGNRHKCECVYGYLGDKCQYADGREKDFIVIFHQAHGSSSPRILPAINRKSEINIFYYANNKNASVTLNSADNTYTLDSNVLMTNGLHQAGAEIHSNVLITLYGFLFVRSQSEGFFVIPTRFVSTEYLIPSFTPYSTTRRSVFSLSSVYSNTIVRIHFKIKDGTIEYDNMQYSNSQTLTLVLNKYTAFQISHTSDLTGTRIIASQPIVVVSGNLYNQVIGIASIQPFIEMVLPTNQIDNVYVIPYLKN
ncbi:unnamed protein product [Mytilus edulis]|uniref:EGF-like domain-containing protein n=1 Tax=Mytilus edulis TaxID=6550 RepID=A0A8S3RT80_MYTED|nr:unnamed protein product [Mytilus edulis]